MRMLGARYYLPALGRFLTQDPIGLEGGTNLYACCANSPPAARLVDKKPPNDL
jgi:RHS repeat-associated protein